MLKPFSAIAVGALLGFGIVAAVNAHMSRVTAATITQCEEKDWPAEDHLAHVAFCRNYLGIHVR